jgi:two-component system, NtrC family, sensor kinase
MQSPIPKPSTFSPEWVRWHRFQSLSHRLRVKAKARVNRLKIHQKIGYGYGLAIGITTIGTVLGLTIGNHYQVQARNQLEYAHRKASLLSELKSAVLEARLHQQQFISLVDRPDAFASEYAHFRESVNRISQLSSELNLFFNQTRHGASDPEANALIQFLQTHDETTKIYFQQTQALVQKVDPSSLRSRQVNGSQQLMLSAISGDIITKIELLSNELTQLIKTADGQEENAGIHLKEAEALQILLIVVGMILSIVIATLLVRYTSRAIARPIEAVTSVARKATQNTDFELQAPVTTDDEVGVLATSLNHFIQRVRCLLQEQELEAKRQTLQSEKMSSLGELMAGLAHEINNPVNFIYGNLRHTEACVSDLLLLVNLYESEVPHCPQAVQSQADAMDLDFLKEDLPKQLQSMKVGAERVRQIVLSLRDFSRLDETMFCLVDLHECIDSTLLLLKSRIKKGISIVHDYGDIPSIEGFSGSLYQVFMNLFSNAMDALEEAMTVQASQDSTHPQCSLAQILITTRALDRDWVEVQVADNGLGIEPELQQKIFETFFTTKPRGIGTGLGLPISHQIVVEKHGGQLTCQSQVGKGTTFTIVLPIRQREREAEEAILQLGDVAILSTANSI